jgi:hypothetical protein
MEQYYVTKKKYDWIVRHNGEELILVEEWDDAIAEARHRAQAVVEKGGEAEILVANVVGMWDRLPIEA